MNMQKFTKRICLLLLCPALFLFSCKNEKNFSNEKCCVKLVNSKDALWEYIVNQDSYKQGITAPRFEIDGREIVGVWKDYRIDTVKFKSIGVTEYHVKGPLQEMPDVTLQLNLRMSAANPIVRFSYELHSGDAHQLTKSTGKGRISYFSTSFKSFNQVKEVDLSEFLEVQHTYILDERAVADKDFEDERALNGQIMVAQGGENAVVMNYEHGSQIPDNYLHYNLKKDRQIELVAVKGNYYDGQSIQKSPYRTIWMNFGCAKGNMEDMAKAHREHVLKYMTSYNSSRQPYIFYNTWNYQERNQAWNKKPYLASMNLKRILQEIDVAHRMGIDVFVMDTGWFGKTGDWQVNLDRFPDDFKQVKSQLDKYGMKLGLWFNADAALSSKMLTRNRQNIEAYDGKKRGPHAVWETEDSYNMCMVSSFSDDFANELIRVGKKYGVQYFKWDAFSQYGCNEPGHFHGTSKNSPQERADNFSFQLPMVMAHVAEKIEDAIPGAIIDFDVTESARAFGLAFLEAGKFFILNNGPYYQSLDDPQYAPGGGMGANVLVFPGVARAANCRNLLPFDKWIPSVLLLTHYLPDDPEYSQWLNLGSLVLGNNGVWGDLLSLSDDGIKRFHETLSKYKQVRDDITESFPVCEGEIGGSPEIHEKINPKNGKGVVVIFNNARPNWVGDGKTTFDFDYTYVTEHPVDKSYWANQDVAISFDKSGRAKIKAHFKGAGAKIIFFGVI